MFPVSGTPFPFSRSLYFASCLERETAVSFKFETQQQKQKSIAPCLNRKARGENRDRLRFPLHFPKGIISISK